MRSEIPYLPSDNETINGKFIHTTGMKLFRGQKLPSHFNIYASDSQELSEGQEIGRTRFGQILYWINNQVVARG